MSILEEITSLKEELIQLRRDFHQYPELGFKEFLTAEKIASYLHACGLKIKTQVAKTGVTAFLAGEGDRTLLLRADMDALPLKEETRLPFSSNHEGVMHACGHDGHMAMLLVAAKVLSSLPPLPGNILFVFQPNEEKEGAKAMIQEGILEGVDGAMACHLWSSLPSGELGLSKGAVMGGLQEFSLILKGQGGHTAAPHKAFDPIVCATTIIRESQLMQCRVMDPLTPTAIVFGSIHGGTTSNIIPGQVQLEGTIRYLSHEGEGRLLVQHFQSLVSSICKDHHLEYELAPLASSPPLYNNDSMVDPFSSIAQGIVGRGHLREVKSLAGEDFAEFTTRVPGLFYFIGCGNTKKGPVYPHHHPCFDIDEDVLVTGVKLHVFGALNYLNHEVSQSEGKEEGHVPLFE